MIKISSILATVLILGTIYSCGKSEINSDQHESETQSLQQYSYAINFVPAKTNSELGELRLEKNNLVRTQAELDHLIKKERTPLSKMSPDLLDAFKETVVFREGVGVVGFNYELIKSNMSENDYTTVTSYFGIDVKNGYWAGASAISNPNARQALEDHKGYYCKYKGTCETLAGTICLSGC